MNLTFESMYYCWELYALIAQQPSSYQVMTSEFVAHAIEDQQFKKKINILEPFSGPIPYFRDDIIHFCKKKGIEVANYDCLEFIDHGKLPKENGITIGDICTYNPKRRYDVVFVSYGSMACMLKDAKQNPYELLQRALTNIRNLLNPEGIFVVNTNSACTVVMNDIISTPYEVTMPLTENDLLVKNYGVKLPANLTYKYKSYYDHSTGQCLCIYDDIKVGTPKKIQMNITLKLPTVISPFCEPEFVRNCGQAGWDTSLAEFYQLDQEEGYPKFSYMEQKEFREFIPAEFIVFSK